MDLGIRLPRVCSLSILPRLLETGNAIRPVPQAADPACFTTLHLRLQIGDHVEEALIQPSVFGYGFLDGYVGDVQAPQHGDAAPLLFVHHVDRVQPVALAQEAVVSCGYAAALRVAQIDRPGVET